MTATRSDQGIAAKAFRAPLRWRASVVSRAWWLSPPMLSICLWLPLTWVALSVDPAAYRLYYRTPKFIDGEFARLMVLATAGFALGAFGALQVVRSRPRKLSGQWLMNPGFRRLLIRLWALGAGSTLIVATVRLGGPGPLLSELSAMLVGERGQSDEVRDIFAPVSGLTSFTQLGILILIIETMRLTWARGAEDARTSRRRIAVVVAWGLFRAFFVSERLAIVELVVPAMVIWARGRRIKSPRQVLLAVLFPVIAAVGLLYAFAATEYFRSYQYYQEQTDDSLIEFSRTRLAGYYSTSLNNSALHLKHAPDEAVFSLLLQGPLDWPGVRKVLDLPDPRKRDAKTLLETYANPEFNNIAPVGPLVHEGGSFYMVSVMVAFGAIAGISYAGYRFGSPGGSAWFAIVVVGMVEFPRIWFLTNSRLSAVAIVSLVAWLRYRRFR